MADPEPQENIFTKLIDAASRFARFVEEHRPDIEAAGIWGTVNGACVDAQLYAPFNAEAWQQIYEEVRSQRRDGRDSDAGPVILDVYAPAGVGFEALAQELRSATALADRRHETEEVIASLVDGRNYVATCSALPLVEFVLTQSAGHWKQAPELTQLLRARLHDEDPKFDEGLLLGYAAVEMVFNAIPEVWKPERHPIGRLVQNLNRHFVLHGTGVGWDDAANATRAVLLLAATARVVGLFAQD
jgi:hypothetical protein